MKALRRLYTAQANNEVMIYATNLKEFVDKLQKLEPDAKDYFHYRREFMKSNLLYFIGAQGDKYTLQDVMDLFGDEQA
jgi:hypothetical protein